MGLVSLSTEDNTGALTCGLMAHENPVVDDLDERRDETRQVRDERRARLDYIVEAQHGTTLDVTRLGRRAR